MYLGSDAAKLGMPMHRPRFIVLLYNGSGTLRRGRGDGDMAHFALSRVRRSLVVLWGMLTLLFGLGRLTPVIHHAPMDKYPESTGRFGNGEAVWIQYVHWMTHVLTGNLGQAAAVGKPVIDVIAAFLPATLSLLGLGVVTALGGALATTVVASRWRGHWVGRVLVSTEGVARATPVLVVAVWGWMWMALMWHWFPLQSDLYAASRASWLSRVDHFVLPMLLLAIAVMAGVTHRLTRGLLLELRASFVRVGHAKGASEWRVLVRHGLWAAVPGVVTQLAPEIPSLFGAALFITWVCNYPGLSRQYVGALQSRDLPLSLGLLAVVGFLSILGRLASELACAWLDPRLRCQCQERDGLSTTVVFHHAGCPLSVGTYRGAV